MGRFFGLSPIPAGFIAVLVGYTSSAAIVFQAASAAGAGPAHISSWLLALGLGMGSTCIGLSLYFRSPVLTAWSTPGAALLGTAALLTAGAAGADDHHVDLVFCDVVSGHVSVPKRDAGNRKDADDGAGYCQPNRRDWL